MANNVIQIIYDLYTNAGVSNKLLDCSSYFDDIEVGTLWENASAGDTSIKVKISVPVLLKTNEEITITEGSTTEDVTVTTGNAVTSKYPPYITLTIDALSNAYGPAATVTWKQRSTLDTDFSFDAEYNFCDIYDYEIVISFDRTMTYLQAIEETTKHADCFTYPDNWGVERIHTYRPHYFASVQTVDKDNALAIPDPTMEMMELVNEIKVKYGYDYANSEFQYETIFPTDDDTNKSYIRNNLKRRKTINLPGVYRKIYADIIVKHKYYMWENGLELIRWNATLKEILCVLGDRRALTSEWPDIDTEIEVMGISISLSPNINIELFGYDAEKIWNNWFMIASSELGTGRVLW